MKWYVLFVETGKEEIVLKWIHFYFNKKFLTAIAPQRVLIEKREHKPVLVYRLLFPGYIFIRTDIDSKKYYILKSIPGFIRILGDDEEFYEISNNEISIILKLSGENSIINCSKVYVENSLVKIISGPLTGLEGIIKKIDKHRNRAKVLISLLGEERLIDLGIDLINSLF